MRRTRWLITTLLAAGLAAGCTHTDVAPAGGTEGRDPAAAQHEKVEAKVGEAAAAVQDYAFDRKAELVAAMKAELEGARQELDRLAADTERASGDAKATAQVKLAEVRAKWEEAKLRLGQVEAATEDSWNDMRAGLDRSVDELETAVTLSRQWMSEVLAP